MSAIFKESHRCWLPAILGAISLTLWMLDHASLSRNLASSGAILREQDSKLDGLKRLLLKKMRESDAVGRSLTDFPEIELLSRKILREGTAEWGWLVEQGRAPQNAPQNRQRIAYPVYFANYNPSEQEPSSFTIVVENGCISDINEIKPTY
ncbi:MAG: hypothetical protein KDB00_06035 [Planctomycetales bacterium]|nr:hypothetical protein [Planctomycetales bacterium]